MVTAEDLIYVFTIIFSTLLDSLTPDLLIVCYDMVSDNVQNMTKNMTSKNWNIFLFFETFFRHITCGQIELYYNL